MAAQQLSWFLTFLSGQIKPEDIDNPEVDSALDEFDLIADDKESLWDKEDIRNSYQANPNIDPDRERFDQEYDSVMDLYKKREIRKVVERGHPKFEGGGILPSGGTDPNDDGNRVVLGHSLMQKKNGRGGITKKEAIDRLGVRVSDPRSMYGAYQQHGISKPGESYNILDYKTPEQVAAASGQIFDQDENDGKGGFRKRGFLDILDTKVVYDPNTGKIFASETENGEDVYAGQKDGLSADGKTRMEPQVLGMLGIWGAREKESGDSGIIDMSLSFSKHILAASANFITGTIRGVNEAAMAANGMAGILPQTWLENANTALVASTYRPSEDYERDALSLRGAMWMIPDTVAQIGGALLAGKALKGMGVKPINIENSVAGLLTLYGANEMFHLSRSYGLNDRSAALVYGTSLTALYGTNKLATYLTKAFASSDLHDLARKVYRGTITPATVEAINNGVLKENVVARTLWTKFSSGLGKLQSGEMMKAAGEESLQEALELGVEYANHAMSYFGAKAGGSLNDKGNAMFDEQWKLSSIGENMLASVLYGGIGGAAGAGLKNILTPKGKDPMELIKFLVKEGKGDFDENYAVMREVLEKDHKAGKVGSTKIGVNKNTKRMDVITDKNQDEVISLNDFFYRTQLLDLETAKQSWDNSGINRYKESFNEIVKGADFTDWKLKKTEKAIGAKLVQQEIMKSMKDLIAVDNEIAELFNKRSPQDTPQQVAEFNAKLKGGTFLAKTQTKIESEGEQAPKKTVKKKGKAAPKRKPKTRTMTTDMEIPADESLEGKRERIMKRIQEIESGERTDEIYQNILVDTEVSLLDPEDPSKGFDFLASAFKRQPYHRSVQQFNNVNGTMQFAIEQEQARIDAANLEVMNNYALSKEVIDTFDGTMNLPDLSDFDTDKILIEDQFNAFNPQLEKMLAYGLLPSEKATLLSKLKGTLLPYLDQQKAEVQKLEQEHNDWKAANPEATADEIQEDLDQGYNIQLEQLEYLQKTIDAMVGRVENTVAPVQQEMDDRNKILEQQYLKTITEVEYKANDKKPAMKNMMSGDEFIDDQVKEEEARAARERDEYTDTAGLKKIMESIVTRIAQAKLNGTANRKANEFRDNILEALIDARDSNLGTVEKILAYKRAQHQAKTISLHAGGLEKAKNSADWTSLTDEEMSIIVASLDAMKRRVGALITFAENNAPSYSKVRLRQDIRFAWYKAARVSAFVNSLAGDDRLTEDVRDAVVDINMKIESMAQDMFEDGKIADEADGRLNDKGTQEALQQLMELSTEADYLLHDYYRDKPDIASLALSTTKPAKPTDMPVSATDYSYLKAIIALNPHRFMRAYSDEVQEMMKNKDAHISSFMQVDSIRTAVGLAMANSDAGDYNPEILVDQLMITGVQGSGKTTQVAAVAIRVWHNLTSDNERINPSAQDATIEGFISTSDKTFIVPVQNEGKSIYAEYEGGVRVPIVKAQAEILEADAQGWSAEFAKAKIKKVNRDGTTKPLKAIPIGSYLYVNPTGASKTIYVLDDLNFGVKETISYNNKLKLHRTTSKGARVLAVSKYQYQADKLASILGPVAETLPATAGDNQIEALITRMEKAVEDKMSIGKDLIVFDEATLISRDSLMKINKALYEYNKGRFYSTGDDVRDRPLKIMYLGDVKQVGMPGGLQGFTKGVWENTTKPDGSKHSFINTSSTDSFVIDRTDELTFGFRSGVKAITDVVNIYREDKYNDGLFPGYHYRSGYYVGPAGARGVQFTSPAGKANDVKKLVKSLGDKSQNLVYIMANLPDHEIADAKAAIIDMSGLLPTQVMTVSEAQGREFDYTIVDLELNGRDTHQMQSMADELLNYQMVSGVGRSRYSSLIVTSDKDLLSSRPVQNISDVQSYKKIETSQKERDAFAKFMQDFSKRNEDKALDPANVAPMAPLGTVGSIDDKVLNTAHIQANVGPLGFKVSEVAGEVIFDLMDATGANILKTFTMRFNGSNNALIGLFNETASKDGGEGATDVLQAFKKHNGLDLDQTDTQINQLVGVDPGNVTGITAAFVKFINGKFVIQQIQRIVNVEDRYYLIPKDAQSEADITEIDEHNPVDLAAVRIRRLHSEFGAETTFEVLDDQGKAHEVVMAFDQNKGVYELAGPTGDIIELTDNTFTLEDVQKLLACGIIA